MNKAITTFLLEALESELCNVQIHETALQGVHDETLRLHWKRSLVETRLDARVYAELLERLGLDPWTPSPGREAIRRAAAASVTMMKTAVRDADPEHARILAGEAIADAETTCHLNWQLVKELGKQLKGDAAEALRAAHARARVRHEDDPAEPVMDWEWAEWIQHVEMLSVPPASAKARRLGTHRDAYRATRAG